MSFGWITDTNLIKILPALILTLEFVFSTFFNVTSLPGKYCTVCIFTEVKVRLRCFPKKLPEFLDRLFCIDLWSTASSGWFLRAAHKLKVSVKDFFNKCEQIYSFLGIWSQKRILHGKLHFFCSEGCSRMTQHLIKKNCFVKTQFA